MISETTLLLLAEYIKKETGIVYASHNLFQLERRVEEAAALMGRTVQEICAEIHSGISASLGRAFLDIATNNETSFFRDPRIFRAIENLALSNHAEKKAPMRIWSAASSTGQEALSMAILILDFAKRRSLNLPFSILASDISERVLEKAKLASYSSLEISRGLQPDHLDRYFHRNDQGFWVASSELTKHIEFRKVNLKESFAALGEFDLILCRNVLIYQNLDGKREIMTRLLERLVPGGFLVLGAGETLIGISDVFDQVQCDGATLYRKKDKQAKAS